MVLDTTGLVFLFLSQQLGPKESVFFHLMSTVKVADFLTTLVLLLDVALVDANLLISWVLYELLAGSFNENQTPGWDQNEDGLDGLILKYFFSYSYSDLERPSFDGPLNQKLQEYFKHYIWDR